MDLLVFLRRPSLQFDFDPNEKLENMTNQIAHRGPDAKVIGKMHLMDCFLDIEDWLF